MRAEVRHAIVNTAHAISSEALAQMLVTALMRPGVVLSRIWLSARDHLHLAGSAGAPTGGGTYSRLDGQFGRIPAGEGKIGQIAQARAPLIVRSLRGDEDWLANPGWIARQGVRAFLGYPLIHAREVFGVLAIFDRAACGDETIAEIEFVADYAAARLKDLRDRAALQAQLTVSGKRSATRTAPLAPQIVTRADLRSLEKQTIEAALAQSRGRVFGPHGAAMLLGMKPTTLASRIKALGIGDGRSGPASP